MQATLKGQAEYDPNKIFWIISTSSLTGRVSRYHTAAFLTIYVKTWLVLVKILLSQ